MIRNIYSHIVHKYTHINYHTLLKILHEYTWICSKAFKAT